MTETVYNGFRRIDFLFEGMEAVLVFPEQPNTHKNWLLKKAEALGVIQCFGLWQELCK